MAAEASTDSVRIDRWLCAARIYKSRTASALACSAGHVRVNETVVKPSALVRIGDEVAARAPRGLVLVRLLALADRRQSPVRARELYEDHSPPPATSDEPRWLPPRRKGRPTKLERRETERLRRR